MSPLPNPFDFRGRRVLVTGGSRGIGAVLARGFADQGASVVINYSRDDRAAADTAGAIRDAGGKVEVVKANLAQPDEIATLFATIGRGGGLDVLIHNAAVGSFKPTSEVRANQWDLTIGVGARALLVCAQHAAPLLPDGTGRILSLSSLGSHRVVPKYGAIGVSKAALESLTRYLAVEFAPRGITVNALSASLVDAPSVKQHPDYARMAESTIRRTPLGRMMAPADLLPLALFLCSPAAQWVVGQTLVADGGHSLWV